MSRSPRRTSRRCGSPRSSSSSGIIEAETEQAFIRTIGRSFARLADWQVRAFLGAMVSGSQEDVATGDLAELEKVIPLGEKVQAYVWRRHLVNSATRLLLTDSDDGLHHHVRRIRRHRRLHQPKPADEVERTDRDGRAVRAGHGRVDHRSPRPRRQDDRRRGDVRARRPEGGRAPRAGAPRRARRRRRLSRAPHRHGLRRRAEPHGRRVRSGGERRLPSHVGGQARLAR